VWTVRIERRSFVKHILAGAAAALVASLVAAPAALGHGSMADPPSRSYKIFLDNPQTPQGDAARAAIAVSGTQAFYDWHEISRNIPGFDYASVIPDGELAGAGREKYAGLNLARTDWYATPMVAGARVCRFAAATAHDPSYFRAFITRDGYDPRQPLKWSDLVAIEGGETAELRGSCGRDSGDCHCGSGGAGLSYYMTLQIPERIGRHVLFVIWQRQDPAAEVFFSTSDLDFGGVDYGEGGGDSGDAVQIPLGVQFAYSGQWVGGGQGAFTVTNTSAYTLRDWKLDFDWGAQVTNAWDGAIEQSGNHYTVTALPYNMAIPPGGSVTVGCIVTTPVPGLLPTSLAARGTLPAGTDPCPGDADADGDVDAADLGLLLGSWGAPSPYDYNGDGITNGADIATILSAWGPCG
jgi:predicted carbohydrate-binding protein with CBM5 and CBM33 domain